MSVSDFQTHPVFRRGAGARVRLLIYVTICVALLVLDLRLGYVEPVRGFLRTLTSPVIEAVSKAAMLVRNATGHFSNLADLQVENTELRQLQFDGAERLLRFETLEQENAELRSLLGMRERTRVTSIAAEVLYNMPDSSSRKIIIDRGKQTGITHGLAVVDADGLLGQVTRVYPVQSEVTLITDRNQAIPVKVLRNGLRGVIFGAGQGVALSDVSRRWQHAIQSDTGPGTLELRFVLANADIKPNDRLVTSGLDGVFLPGLPVAEVESIDREAGAFARITCRPLGRVERSLRVLVLGRAELPPPPPKPETGDPPPPSTPPRARPAGNREG